MLPLFDELPVTQQDIEDWLDTIPNLSRAEFRRAAYAKAYNVPDKIRAAKLAGSWPRWESKTENTTLPSTAGTLPS